jgi:hypothetical protein
MGIDFSATLLLPNFDFWSRDIQVTPIVSQPGAAAYSARGIFRSQGTVIQAGEEWIEDLRDQETQLDIRDVEFAVLPQQGDQIYIYEDGSMPAGSYEITDSWNNGGGETTFAVRKLEPPAP